MHRANLIGLLRRLVLAAVLAAAGKIRAGEATAPTPLTREAFLSALTRDLTAHYNLEGDLQLDLLREFVPPAHVAAG